MQPTTQPYELEPISPQQAVDLYLDVRQNELAKSTLRSHESRLAHFVTWCAETGRENMNDLGPRAFTEYTIWRREQGTPNNVTMNTQIHTLRAFVRKCEGFEAVRPGLHEYIEPIALAPKEDVRHGYLDPELAKQILAYFEKFQYATRDHVTLALLWSTGVRTGTLRGFDVEDYDRDHGVLHAVHRPDEDTPLKNKQEGERPVMLTEDVMDVMDDYISTTRHNVTDDYDRNPLITTSRGRIAKNTIRRTVYGATRPCVYTGRCPHDMEIEDCAFASNKNRASECPSSESPHGIRKGRITYARQNDLPIDVVSFQMDVTHDIIKKHYDKRTKEQKASDYQNYWRTLD